MSLHCLFRLFYEFHNKHPLKFQQNILLDVYLHLSHPCVTVRQLSNSENVCVNY